MIDKVNMRIRTPKILLQELARRTQGRNYRKLFLQHPCSKRRLTIWFNLVEKTLWLEASPPKLLQGHNVFGSNDVERLCLKIVRFIYECLELKWTKSERRKIQKYRIKLNRVDTTCSFRMRSQSQVVVGLEQIWQHVSAGGKAWACYGSHNIEAIYNQPRSTYVAEKFYNKLVELEAHPLGDVMEGELVSQYAKTLLRFEVTWRRPELERRRLNYADCWTKQTAKELMNQRIAKFGFQGQLKTAIEVDDLPGLRGSCKTFYELWRRGVKFGPCRNDRTVVRVRKKLLEFGVDIFRPLGQGTDISLNDLLSESNAYFVGPKALTKRGAIVGFRGKPRRRNNS